MFLFDILRKIQSVIIWFLVEAKIVYRYKDTIEIREPVLVQLILMVLSLLVSSMVLHTHGSQSLIPALDFFPILNADFGGESICSTWYTLLYKWPVFAWLMDGGCEHAFVYWSTAFLSWLFLNVLFHETVLPLLLGTDKQEWTAYEAQQYLASVITHRIDSCSKPISSPDRKDFLSKFVVTPQRENKQHAHGHAAKLRNEAAWAIKAFIATTGLDVYCVAMSATDADCDGERNFYVARDYSVKPRCDEITDRHFISIIDTDYYVDMNALMMLGRPILMYTFVPTTAGYSCSDGQFSIRDNEVHHDIASGGTYQHQVWDYNHDFLTASEISPCGQFMRFVVYEVEQQRVDSSEADHRVVYLRPVRKLEVAIDMAADVPQIPLKRLKMSKGKFNYVSVNTGPELLFSVSERGCPVSVMLTAAEFYSICKRFVLGHGKLNTGDVQRAAALSKEHSALLAGFFADPEFDTTMFGQCTVVAHAPAIQNQTASHYTLVGKIEEDAKEYARRFASCPLSAESVYPTECEANDLGMKWGRLDAVKNNCIPPKRYLAYAKDFTLYMVPNGGQGKSLSCEEVIEMQTEPNQRVRSRKERNYLDAPGKFTVKASQKKEAYGKVAWPRNISQTPTTHQIRLSCYTNVFKYENLRDKSWFAPCCSPHEIATMLYEFVQGFDQVIETDFSKFDGSISRWLRENVEFACYRRWVHPSEYEELNALLKAELDAPGYTQNGVKYNTEATRLSGSPLTTDGNSIINAFSAYCSLREAKLSHHEAVTRIGLIYGDDNVGSSDPVITVNTCKILGLDVKVKVVKRGEPVTYIGRVFVDPWTTTTSFQDLNRTLAKVNSTVSPSQTVPLGVAAYAKVSSYLVSDKLTPVLSSWCLLVQDMYSEFADVVLTEEQKISLRKDLPFCSKQTDSWPQNEGDEDLILNVVSLHLNVPTCDILRFERALQELRLAPGDLGLKLKLLEDIGFVDKAEPEVLLGVDWPVLVNGELYNVGVAELPIPTLDEDEYDDLGNVFDPGLRLLCAVYNCRHYLCSVQVPKTSWNGEHPDCEPAPIVVFSSDGKTLWSRDVLPKTEVTIVSIPSGPRKQGGHDYPEIVELLCLYSDQPRPSRKPIGKWDADISPITGEFYPPNPKAKKH